MGRTLVPLSALRHIAEKIIQTDPRKRTANWRPKSKVAALRDLMKHDPEIYGRVVTMYKQMQADGLKADLQKSGITVRTADEVEDAWTDEKRDAHFEQTVREKYADPVARAMLRSEKAISALQHPDWFSAGTDCWLELAGGPLTSSELAEARKFLVGNVKRMGMSLEAARTYFPGVREAEL